MRQEKKSLETTTINCRYCFRLNSNTSLFSFVVKQFKNLKQSNESTLKSLHEGKLEDFDYKNVLDVVPLDQEGNVITSF